MAFGITSEVDAEVVGDLTVQQLKPSPRPGVIDISQAYQEQGLSQPAADQLAVAETRARAVALFVRVPVLVAVALHPKVPGLLRLGAGLLAAFDAYTIARQEKEIEAMLPSFEQP